MARIIFDCSATNAANGTVVIKPKMPRLILTRNVTVPKGKLLLVD